MRNKNGLGNCFNHQVRSTPVKETGNGTSSISAHYYKEFFLIHKISFQVVFSAAGNYMKINAGVVRL